MRLLFTLNIRVSRKFYLHLCFKLRYYIQNGATFLHKLTPGFKNHLKNLGNFRQAVKSPKSWNLMGYFCPKDAFLQLDHYIPKIYLTLLSTACVKTHQITYVIFETMYKSFLTTRFLCIFFAQTLHTIYKSSPSKCKLSDFPLLSLKFTKFLMSFFKQKVSFSWKFGSDFSVMRDNSSVLFWLKLYMPLRKVAH